MTKEQHKKAEHHAEGGAHHKKAAYHDGYKDGYGHGHKDGKKGKTHTLKAGGVAAPKAHWLDAEGTPEQKEAMEKKRGGRMTHTKKHGGHVEGHEKAHRLDRPQHHKVGGRHVAKHHTEGGKHIGSDKNPLTTAARVTKPEGHNPDADMEGQ